MASKIVKRGKTRWRGNVQVEQEKRQKLFGTRQEAVDWETDMRRQLKTALSREAQSQENETLSGSCRMIDFATRYLSSCKKRMSHSTLNEKTLCFRLLFESVDGDFPVEKLKPGMALSYLEDQLEARSGHAANKDRKNFIAAWNWARKNIEGLDELGNPFKLTETMPEEEGPRYVPTLENFYKVLAVAKGQDRVFLHVFFHTAARRKEVFNLKWDDVDFGNSTIRLFTRKRRGGSLQANLLPMSGTLRKELETWKENHKNTGSDFVFTVLDSAKTSNQYAGEQYKGRQHFMHNLCEKAKVKHFGFHAIRHMVATLLFKRGEPLSNIQGLLRHMSPQTTVRYLEKLGCDDIQRSVDLLATVSAEFWGEPGMITVSETQKASGF